MPQDRANASSSHIKVEAAEAVVHADGRIERKEPTVSSDDETSRSNLAASIILSNAVNEIFGKDEELESADERPSVKASYSRNLIYLAFGFVFAGFLWSIYSILSERDQDIGAVSREIVQYAKKVEDNVSGSPVEQMEQVANLVIKDNDWNSGRIKLFTKHWNDSEDVSRLKIKNQAWFQHFLYRLETEINNRKRIGLIKTANNATDRSLLIELGLALGLSKSVFQPAKTEKHLQIADLSNHISTKKSNSQPKKENGNLLEREIKIDENKALQVESNDKQPPQATALIDETPVSIVNSNQARKESAKLVSESPAITGQQISQVLDLYKVAYEKGDMQDIASLFGVDHPGSGKQIVAELKQNFETIFSNSARRQIDFNAINWRTQGDSVTVDSDYYASIELTENKGMQYTKGLARINLQRIGSKLYITNVESIGPTNKNTKAELRLASTGKGRLPAASKITPDELRRIVGRFIQAYEAGDAERISGLLAKNAKSNDKVNREGITKDYADLFKVSSHRQLLIQNMTWDNQGEIAKGTGDIEAFIYRGDEQLPYTMRGKIQIVTKKQNNGEIEITHLYHIERKK